MECSWLSGKDFKSSISSEGLADCMPAVLVLHRFLIK